MSDDEMREEVRKRRGASRGRWSLLPRLARWAGVGVFMFVPALVSCADEVDEEVVENGYVYVGTMAGEKDQIYKLESETGEKILSLGGQYYGPLSLDVDEATGGVFVYTPYYLRKYSPSGEELFVVYIGGGDFYDKMVYDAGTGDVWVYLSQYGHMARYDGSNGQFKSRFQTELDVIEQLVYDKTGDVFWIVNGAGYSVRKYSRGGSQLLEIKDEGELGPMANSQKEEKVTVAFYSVRTRSNSVRTYDKNGSLIGEFPTTLSRTRKTHGIGVEPGKGRIWVSDDQKTEIYDDSGQLLNTLNGKGFVTMDFDDRGERMFGITADGKVYGIRTADLEILWSKKTSNPREDLSRVKYSRR